VQTIVEVLTGNGLYETFVFIGGLVVISCDRRYGIDAILYLVGCVAVDGFGTEEAIGIVAQLAGKFAVDRADVITECFEYLHVVGQRWVLLHLVDSVN
jgi:hypothetical protein